MTPTNSSPHIFREYDIRGVVDRDLDENTARRLGSALAATLAPGATVAVGRDCRLHSSRLQGALVAGLTTAGVHVRDIGLVPTPLLYFAVHHLRLDGGIMVTGSHNAAEYNGFKMMRGLETLHGQAIEELRDHVLGGEPAPAPTEPGRVEATTIIDAWLDFVCQDLELSRPMHVVVDAGNGVGGINAIPLLRRLHVEVDELYTQPDGCFPNHHPDPTRPENLVELAERVREVGADFGVGYDGDGDRIGVVDERGEIVWSDRLMILFARDILAEHPGATVVGEVKCSQSLFDDIAARGGHPIMWRVGHSVIKAKMKQSGALLAGEMSGHIFFAHRYLGFDDAAYATARLLEILARSDKPLSRHFDDVPRTFTTPEVRIDVSDAIKFAVAEKVGEQLAEEYAEPITIDGVRVNFGDGWGLVRASNTQPAVVIRVEAQSQRRRDAQLQLLVGLTESAAADLA